MMINRTTPFLAAAAAAALCSLSTSVDAHGLVSKPKAEFKDSTKNTYYDAILTDSVHEGFSGARYNMDPETNTKNFNEGFKKSKIQNLKTMLDTAVPTCGNTRTDVPPVDVSGLAYMEWRNDWGNAGFVESHHGPCEIWIDNTMVLQEPDCRAKYTQYPAQLPVDYSVCKGSCTLTFYWLAVHEPNWQVYKQCVPIQNGGGGGGGGAAGGATSTNSTMATATAATATATATTTTTTTTTPPSTNNPTPVSVSGQENYDKKDEQGQEEDC
jgi:hypothetical protein